MNSPLWPKPQRPGDPRRTGPYWLEGRLGGGGMGQVFLGRSPGGRPVAVKRVRAELAEDPGFRRRFALEAEAARLVGGFYTAQLVDADPDADPPWLVTAYIPGPSAHQAVEAHGPMPAEAITVPGAGLAEGLGAMHACGLVHRDLKPSNVILAAESVSCPEDVGHAGPVAGDLGQAALHQVRQVGGQDGQIGFVVGCTPGSGTQAPPEPATAADTYRHPHELAPGPDPEPGHRPSDGPDAPTGSRRLPRQPSPPPAAVPGRWSGRAGRRGRPPRLELLVPPQPADRPGAVHGGVQPRRAHHRGDNTFDGIRLRDAATGRAKAKLTDRRACALAFHPDGTFLVSGGWYVGAEGGWLWPLDGM
ncbi:protein kinase [Streptomyces sp. NPDC002032]|uniref:protein kinase domain-containing protein n=1 Tax=Streptomyces sp. NPDC002032 TaxID=3364630 RepID=UPI003686D3CB